MFIGRHYERGPKYSFSLLLFIDRVESDVHKPINITDVQDTLNTVNVTRLVTLTYVRLKKQSLEIIDCYVTPRFVGHRISP